MIRKFTIGIVGFLIMPLFAIGAETIYTADTNTTVIAGYGAVARPQSAQSFDSSLGGYVTTISVWMTNENSVTDDVVLSLVEDNAGEPEGTVLESTTKDVVGTTCTEYTWTLSGTTALTSGTTYWIRFGRDGSLDDYDYGLCGNEPSVYAGGTEADEDSGIWTDKDRDAYTEITLEDSPGPGPSPTSTATTTALVAPYAPFYAGILFFFTLWTVLYFFS